LRHGLRHRADRGGHRERRDESSGHCSTPIENRGRAFDRPDFISTFVRRTVSLLGSRAMRGKIKMRHCKKCKVTM
jgi:hypothetical protein